MRSITLLHNNGDGTFSGVPERPIYRIENGEIAETQTTDEKGNVQFATGKIFVQETTSAPPNSIDKVEVNFNVKRIEAL